MFISPLLPSILGLGCARVGSFNNPQPYTESRKVIRSAVEMGVRVIDTSNVYGQGDSEAQIGLAINGIRESAFIVTKGGRRFSRKVQLLKPFKPVLKSALLKAIIGSDQEHHKVTSRRESHIEFDWSPDQLTSGLESSLVRLKTDYVNGFLLHSPPASIARNPNIGRELQNLKNAGKILHWGVSCDDLETLEAALTLTGLTIIQLPFDVLTSLSQNNRDEIAKRGLIVLAREVIRAQRKTSVIEAVRNSISDPIISTTLIGTTSLSHLRQIVEDIGHDS